MNRPQSWYTPTLPTLPTRLHTSLGDTPSGANLGVLLVLAAGVLWLAVKVGEPFLKAQRATRTPPARGLRHLAGG